MKNAKRLVLALMVSMAFFSCESDTDTQNSVTEKNIQLKSTDKTYTLSANSFFTNQSVDLKVLLPAMTSQNPYSFTAFDISQVVNGQQQNAVFIYMKTATGTDLSTYDDDRTEHNYSFGLSAMTPLNNLSGFTSFAPLASNSLVIVYHDTSNDPSYKQACAQAAFANVPTYTANVAANGNFQTNLSFMGGQPKKAGMSLIPRQ